MYCNYSCNRLCFLSHEKSNNQKNLGSLRRGHPCCSLMRTSTSFNFDSMAKMRRCISCSNAAPGRSDFLFAQWKKSDISRNKKDPNLKCINLDPIYKTKTWTALICFRRAKGFYWPKNMRCQQPHRHDPHDGTIHIHSVTILKSRVSGIPSHDEVPLFAQFLLLKKGRMWPGFKSYTPPETKPSIWLRDVKQMNDQ